MEVETYLCMGSCNMMEREFAIEQPLPNRLGRIICLSTLLGDIKAC